MNHSIVLSPDAEADFSSAVWWYEQIDPDLATRFTQEALATLHRIAQYPYSYTLVEGTVRRGGLKHFRYLIYYSLDMDRVSVIAVVHERRDDCGWMGRGNDYS